MTFGSDRSISKGEVDLERVPFYVESLLLNSVFYFGIFIQSAVAQLVTKRALNT